MSSIGSQLDNRSDAMASVELDFVSSLSRRQVVEARRLFQHCDSWDGEFGGANHISPRGAAGNFAM